MYQSVSGLSDDTLFYGYNGMQSGTLPMWQSTASVFESDGEGSWFAAVPMVGPPLTAPIVCFSLRDLSDTATVVETFLPSYGQEETTHHLGFATYDWASIAFWFLILVFVLVVRFATRR